MGMAHKETRTCATSKSRMMTTHVVLSAQHRPQTTREACQMGLKARLRRKKWPFPGGLPVATKHPGSHRNRRWPKLRMALRAGEGGARGGTPWLGRLASMLPWVGTPMQGRRIHQASPVLFGLFRHQQFSYRGSLFLLRPASLALVFWPVLATSTGLSPEANPPPPNSSLLLFSPPCTGTEDYAHPGSPRCLS